MAIRGLNQPTQEDAWSDFMYFIDKNSTSNRLFRGVSSTSYDLTPKIRRQNADGRRTYQDKHEKVVFDNFKRRAFPHIDRGIQNDWDLLAIAQHYGLPTRLLDWTTNALIAAWFACYGETNGDGLVYVVRIEDRHILTRKQFENTDPFSNNFTVVKFIIPVQTVPRISKQGGVFSYHPDNQIGSYIPSLRSRVFKFGIKAEYKRYFLTRLFRFGVDQAHVMSDLDGIAGTLDWQARANIAVGSVISL